MGTSLAPSIQWRTGSWENVYLSTKDSKQMHVDLFSCDYLRQGIYPDPGCLYVCVCVGNKQ